ncbi:hypothetical protein [Bradyrhizobium embrapense]|uniref:hypothetical protein n=1 Tax=Bradyrhizobium embrapense TaxID=630921 RepID=UPI000A944E81|nr:hypothetical protein [Bradyrhizobium embrapense]
MFDTILRFFRPHRSSPWDSAPPWALELKHMQERILRKEDQQMSAQDDLNNAVVALAAGYGSLHTAILPVLQVIADNANGNSVITQAVANIQAVTGKMADDAAALTAAVPAATTVSPPPASQPVVQDPPSITPPSIDPPTVTDPAATPPTGDASGS